VRYLILSDLHANDEALTAVLRRVKRKTFDRVVCLGDFVGYAADPNKVLDRFRKLRKTTISVRGNHDKVVSGVDEGLCSIRRRSRRRAGRRTGSRSRTWTS
jgi:Calcineurin-like phosphoesterase.